jgi:hypothetical protein
MHGKTRTARPAPSTLSRRPDAITWVDRRRAIVARRTSRGAIDVEEFPFPPDEPGRLLAIAAVVHAIGESDRVVVMGPESARTRLEREYVAISHRPDRLVDVEREGPVSREDLIGLLGEQTD